MPIIKSAKKRVKVARRATVANAKTKRAMREAVKAFKTALASKNSKQIGETFKSAVSAIDQATKKDVIHKNKAARAKATLAAQAKLAGVKLEKTAKTPAKPKPAVKKTAVKKTAPAKKTVTKKSTKK